MAHLTATKGNLDVVYNVHRGNFILPIGTIYSCRVTFHRYYYSSKARFFYYCINTEQHVENVLNVMTEVENVLNLETMPFSTVNDNKFVLHCMPCEWWHDPIRFSFLTSILRDAKTDLEQTLKSGFYLSQTRKAAKEFLSGNTFYQKETFDGWVNEFNGDGNLFFGEKSGEVKSKLSDKPVKERNTVLCCHHIGWDYVKLPLAQK